jgi:hypothetical protein
MLYLGIDQHKRQLTVNLRGEDGTVKQIAAITPVSATTVCWAGAPLVIRQANPLELFFDPR